MTEDEYERSTAIVNALIVEEGDEIDLNLPHIYLSEFDISDSDPQTFMTETIPWHEAMKPESRDGFQNAMGDELKSLLEKEVYEEVATLPPDRKSVGCKWVLAIKRHQNGEIERFKARLVAQGFTQIEGQDFTHTFALVAKWSSLHAILAISALRDFELQHIDVKTVCFLEWSFRRRNLP